MLENKNINNLKSELVTYSPNVNSLMKISLGLIFFTILSTAFVYAEDSFDVAYSTTGMSIIEIESDTESMSLIFSVDVTDLNGKLNIVLERAFFDSVYNRINSDFIILADGDYALFEETEINSKTRTLSITVPSGTEDIEIIGSILDDSLPIILVDSNKNKSLSDVMDKAAADKAAADKAAADKAAADKAAAAAAAKAPMAVTIEPVEGSGTPGCEPECYSPSTATISAGGTVTFSNTDMAPHTSTSGTAANGPDGVFDTSLIMANASFDVTITDAGTYPYFCMVHPWMEGTVIVE